jgi:hypothetical protein
MVLLFVVAVLACAFGLASSRLIAWTSGKSPLWNIGFFVMLAVTGASVLLLAIALLSRTLSP